jgi:hypothetical protein
MLSISDLRSDSPSNFIRVGGSCLGSSEGLNRAGTFRLVAIVRFCWHSEVFGFHDLNSIHKPSSHTRDCSQPYSSPCFSASSDLQGTGVTAVLKSLLEPTQRDCLSAASFTLAQREPGLDLKTVAQLFARVSSSPRRMVRENNGARVSVLSRTKSVDQGSSCAGVSRSITNSSLTRPSLSESDRARYGRREQRTPPLHVARTSTTPIAQLLRKPAANQDARSYEIPSKQPAERSSSCIKVAEQ